MFIDTFVKKYIIMFNYIKNDFKMSKYKFNTQNHLRIWFSSNPNVFLNDENQLRLVNFRHKNPHARLTLLYASSMLNEETKYLLKEFCAKHHFISCDFDSELSEQCIDEIDKNLHKIAKNEIDAFCQKKGGNLGSASDIARFITPLLTKGTYSDFDTNITVKGLSPIQDIDAPIILNLGSTVVNSNKESPYCINDIIGIATKDGVIDPAAKNQLRIIQKRLLQIYNDGPISVLKELSNLSLAYSTNHPLLRFYTENKFHMIFHKSPDISITDFRLFLDKSTRNIFNIFRYEDLEFITEGLDETLKSKLQEALKFEHEDFPAEFTQEEQLKIKNIWLENTQSIIRSQTENFFLIMYQPSVHSIYTRMHNEIKRVKDPDKCFELTQAFQTSVRSQLLKDSVVLFSGPLLLRTILTSYLSTEDDQDIITDKNSFASLSFYGNNLFSNFHSMQSLPLHSTSKATQAKLNVTESSTLCDLSWLPQSQERIKAKEAILNKAAYNIQNFWKKNEKKANKKSKEGINFSKESKYPL